MTEPRWRLDKTALEYGRVCPLCAGPKTVQAAKCRACHVDQTRREWRRFVASVRPELAEAS